MKIILIILVTAFGYLVPQVYMNTLPIQRGIYHCIPVLCPINHYAILCKATDPANPGEDKCLPCGNNFINPTRINTTNNDIELEYANQTCILPDCKCGLEENILANEEECKKTGIKKCVCDRSKHLCSPDHVTCEKWPGKAADIKENHQLAQNCTIVRCEEGYSKPAGDGVCKKDTTSTTQPTTPSTSRASSTDVHNAATEAQTTTTSGNDEDEDGGLGLKILIAIVSVIFVAIIITGFIWFVRNHRGIFNKKCNRDGANPGHHELRHMMTNGRQLETV